MARTSTIQYRYVNLERLWGGFHLKEMVVDVLGRVPQGAEEPMAAMARLRRKDLDQDGSFVLLNKMSPAVSWRGPVFCGQLIHVRQGTRLPGIEGTLDDDVSEFELLNLTLEERARIVEGVLYFALAGNHVGLIEGQRSRARTLERYLSRLLQDAGELEPGQLVVLNARIEGSVQAASQIDIRPRRVKAAPQASTDGPVARRVAEEEGTGATVIEILRILGLDDRAITTLENSIPPGGWLEGTFSVLMKAARGRRAKITREQLEEALRDIAPSALGLLGDGERARGGLVKLTQRRAIQVTGELLDPADAMAQILEALRDWARSGRIDCAFDD